MNDETDQDSRHLMMAVLDAEADEAQTVRFQQLLQTDPSLRREYHELKQLKELTMATKSPAPDDVLWQNYWGGVYRRFERGMGWLLISLGAIPLLLYGSWEIGREWLQDASIPLWIRIAGASLVAGTVILFASVVREKLFFHHHERYKDIQR